MNAEGIPRKRLAVRSSLAALTVACLLCPAAAIARATPDGDGTLSAGLAYLAKPSVRSQSPKAQARILGVAASGPGSLQRQGSRLLVNVRFEQGAIARLADLRSAGARVLDSSGRYQAVTAAVTPGMLRRVAATPGVASVTPSRAPMLYAANCEGGSVISEGVAQLHAETARQAFAVDGSGVTVGVLSDSYDGAVEAADGSGPIATKAAQDIATADLPGTASECPAQTTPVDVLEDLASAEATDEGRAMLQIVHDVAPGASLAFATAFLGEESFAQNIEALAAAGAQVIVDDVGYFEEPFFQDGPVAAAVNKVTGEGVTYLSSAGNDNLFDAEGNEISSWEAPEYRDSGGCPAAVQALEGFNGTHCIDFNPGPNTDRTFGIKVEPEATLTIDLQWAESWHGVGTDLDAFLLNANGELVTGAAEDNLATQRPVEIVQWTNQSASEKTVQLVVNRYSGTIPRLKFALLQNGGGVSATEYPRSGGGDVVGPTVFGHAGAASAIAVGAVPFNNGTAPEEYSSRGPTTHYFGQVEGVAPAPALPSAEIVSKPDIVATDCNATTFFAHRDAGLTWRFCGTSAAAPHAAGTVALMSEVEPAATAGPLRAALVGTGTPMVPYGPCAVGGGLVESLAAAEAAHGDITPVAPEPCSPPGSAGEVFVAPGDWGSEEPPAPASAGEATIPVPGVTLEAPSTSFRRHPRKVVFTRGRTAQVVFRFGSNQAGVSFLCKVDRAPFRRCSARFARRYAVGRHVVRVKARNSAGDVDATPALFRFRVKRVG